jgi:hypothetical protein
MKHHSSDLLRELRHTDADHVEETFSSSFRAALLDSILENDPIPRVAKSHIQGLADPTQLIDSFIPEGCDARPLESPSVRRDRRPLNVLIVFGASAVLTAVIVFQVVPGSSHGPSSAAAAVLTQAAAAAGNQPSVVLEPGQFLYTETRTLQSTTWALGNNEPSWQFDTTQDETIQMWQAENGSGRELVTYNGPAEFTTPASHQGWVLSGEPSIASPTDTPSGQNDTAFIPSDASGSEGMPGESPANDRSLPTDPDSLRQTIENGGPGIPRSVSTNVPDPSTPAGTFEAAAEILETPATGISPALRSALFQVMASVRGVELLGHATDQAGRSGTDIASPMSQYGLRYEIIVDHSTGQILQTEDVLVDPSLSPPVDQKYFGDTAGEVQGWTDYLGSGIVTSTTATAQLQS